MAYDLSYGYGSHREIPSKKDLIGTLEVTLS